MRASKTVYNNQAQAFNATQEAQIAVLGNVVTDVGCSVNVVANGFQASNTGLYRVSYDVTYTPTSVGTVIIQLYEDGLALPCGVYTATTVANAIDTGHVETTLCLPSCCNCPKLIYATITGAEGEINHVCANITRIS